MDEERELLLDWLNAGLDATTVLTFTLAKSAVAVSGTARRSPLIKVEANLNAWARDRA
jgi:hypothetical protein